MNKIGNTLSGSAKAIWRGSFINGKGLVNSTSSKAFTAQLELPAAAKNIETKSNQFTDDPNSTNPEELVAGALSSCINLTFSAILDRMKLEAKSIETESEAVMKKLPSGYEITDVYVNVNANIPGVTESKFNDIIKLVKENCAISKLISKSCTVHINSKLNNNS